MQYRARVVDARQHMVTVSVDAVDADDARNQLLAQGLRLVSMSPVARAFDLGFKGAPKFPLALFAQELLALLQAGLGVMESVDALLEKEGAAATRTVLERLAADLRSGHRLSVALRHQPTAFSALFVGMIAAAERTSNLPEALERFIDFHHRMDAVRAKVVSASVYPAILVVVGGLVTVFLVAYVVPKFALVYQGTGRPLPWASQWMIAWGRFAAAHALVLCCGALSAVGAAAFGLARARRTGALGRWVRRLPWVGERLRTMELSRIYLTLGLLLEGGMAVHQALQLLSTTVKGDVRERLVLVRTRVSEGQTLSSAFEAHGLAMPVVMRLLKVGEQSGQLGAMLRRAALFHEGETSRWIDRFTRAFEPALMAVIGVVIGLIVLLLYMPIFDLAGSFQ